MIKLELCPFCSGQAEIIILKHVNGETKSHNIKCSWCNLNAPKKRRLEDVIKHWNTRNRALKES